LPSSPFALIQEDSESISEINLEPLGDPLSVAASQISKMSRRYPESGQSSQGSQPTPMLADGARTGDDSQEDGSPQNFETLQNFQNFQQPVGQPYEDSQHSQQSANWATEDFDLVEFVGQDDQSDSFSTGASANGDLYPNHGQFGDFNSEKEFKEDNMYSVLQYNDMAVGHDNNQQQMYGHVNQLNDMGNNGFMQDNRYSNTAPNSLLNNTIEKLHNQQQIQQQPSTSRLSNVVNNTPSYPNRMRPNNMVNTMVQPSQLNSSDLGENVLLPTSSTSPQNNNMYLTQPIVKCEPATNYDMVGDDDYYNSTSDNESHYSTNGLALSQTGSNGKPRKYRIKPESERVNPQYRAKRAKNNDAVRRSR